METTIERIAELERAGFTAAAKTLERKLALARRLAIAYEHFRYVTKEQVEAFNKALRERTKRPPTKEETSRLLGIEYIPEEMADTLRTRPIAKYDGVPPADVLAAVAKAKSLEVFDGFTVADICPTATKAKYIDPIIFGHIEGCSDRFFIAEWGNDVSIADIIKSTEG